MSCYIQLSTTVFYAISSSILKKKNVVIENIKSLTARETVVN